MVITLSPALLLNSALLNIHRDRRVENGRGISLAERVLFKTIAQPAPGCIADQIEFVNTTIETWLSDLVMFVAEGESAIGYRDKFFRKIALPITAAQILLSDQMNPNRKDAALAKLSPMPSGWLKSAMSAWITQQPEINVNGQPATARRA